MILQSSTSLSQWQSLVLEAEQATGLLLYEELESYLVFMMMRFLRKPDAATRIIALDYLDALYRAGRETQQQLQKVSDRCLLVCGLFPKITSRRQVSISYYVDMGRSAYHSLCQRKMDTLFLHLTDKFIALMDVLHAVRRMQAKASIDSLMDPFSACELYQDTASRSAAIELGKSTQNLPLAKQLVSRRRH